MRFFLAIAIYCTLFIYENSVADDNISLAKHIELLQNNKVIKGNNFVPIFNFSGELNIKYSENISDFKKQLLVTKDKSSNDYIIIDSILYNYLAKNKGIVFDYNIPENKKFFDDLSIIIKNNDKFFLDYEDIESNKYTNHIPDQTNLSNFYTDQDYRAIISNLIEYNNYIDKKFKNNISLFLAINLGFYLNIDHGLLNYITSMIQLRLAENGSFIENKTSLHSIDNIAKYALFLGFNFHNESEIDFKYGSIADNDLPHRKYINEFAIDTEISKDYFNMSSSFRRDIYPHTGLETLLIQSNDGMNFENQSTGFNLVGTIKLNDHLNLFYDSIYFNHLNGIGNKKYNNSFLIPYKNAMAGNIGIEFDINARNKIGFYWYNESVTKSDIIDNININNNIIHDKIGGNGFGGMYQYIEEDTPKYQIAWALYNADYKIYYNKWNLINFNYNDNLIKFNPYYYVVSLKKIMQYKSFSITTVFKNQFSDINDMNDDRLVNISLDGEFDLREFLGDKSICDNEFCRYNDITFKMYSGIKYLKYIDRQKDNNSKFIFNIGMKILF